MICLGHQHSSPKVPYRVIDLITSFDYVLIYAFEAFECCKHPEYSPTFSGNLSAQRFHAATRIRIIGVMIHENRKIWEFLSIASAQSHEELLLLRAST